MKRYIKKVKVIDKNRKLYKRIIFRKELYTFKNTYNFKILNPTIGDNCKNKAKFKKIKDKNIQNNIRNILDNTNSFKERVLFLGRNKKKEKREILKDINLDIQKGEVVGLIGINGSRKVNIIKINDKNNISR